MKARVRGTELFFDVEGAGIVPDGPRMVERPIAFLIHGGPGTDHSALKSRYGSLAERLQVVYYDLRGQGRSARGDSRRYTIDEDAEDLEALRQYLGAGPIVSAGTSYGGMVALAHAVKYPDSVSHLVLIGTVAHGASLIRARELIAARASAEQLQQFDDMFSGRVDTAEKFRHYLRVMAPVYARSYSGPGSEDGLSRCILTAEALVRAHGPNGYMREWDIRPQLSAITAPTMILSGRHDCICPPEFSMEMHRLIRDSQLRIFEESAHSIGVDEPQKLVDAIFGFVVYNTRATARKDSTR